MPAAEPGPSLPHPGGSGSPAACLCGLSTNSAQTLLLGGPCRPPSPALTCQVPGPTPQSSGLQPWTVGAGVWTLASDPQSRACARAQSGKGRRGPEPSGWRLPRSCDEVSLYRAAPLSGKFGLKATPSTPQIPQICFRVAMPRARGSPLSGWPQMARKLLPVLSQSLLELHLQSEEAPSRINQTALDMTRPVCKHSHQAVQSPPLLPSWRPPPSDLLGRASVPARRHLPSRPGRIRKRSWAGTQPELEGHWQP